MIAQEKHKVKIKKIVKKLKIRTEIQKILILGKGWLGGLKKKYKYKVKI